jgi:hypothetical protein
MYLPVWIRLYRIVIGALALYGVYDKRQAMPWSTHFYDAFTNQSGIVAGVILLLGGTILAQREPTLWWDYARGAGVMVALLTGVVFATLLDGLYNPFVTSNAFWADTLFHQALPIVMVLDLLIVPLSRRVNWWGLVIFPIYPVGYLLYSLWRGQETGWYPYRFMDPDAIGRYAPLDGWAGVALTNGVLLAGFVIVSALGIGVSRMRTGQAAAPARLPETSMLR